MPDPSRTHSLLALNRSAPLNWSHRLNHGLVTHLLGAPGFSGGNTWFDLCRNANGALVGFGGTGWRGTNRPGGLRSLQFDGATTHVDLPTLSIPSDVTMSLWVNYASTPSNAILINKEPTNSQWSMLFEGSVLYVRGASGSVTCSATPPSTNAWHHLVGTITGTTGVVYINGAQAGTGAMAAIGNGSGVIDVGRFGDFGAGYYYGGLLADIRVYNRALTAGEVANLYLESRAGYPNLLNRVNHRRIAATGGAVAAIFRRTLQNRIGSRTIICR